MNHSRLPKEVNLPDWARRDKHGKKGDRGEAFLKLFCSLHLPSRRCYYLRKDVTSTLVMRIIYITFEAVEKAIKCNCDLCAAAEKVTFDSVLNSKYFIHAMKFWWPTQKVTQSFSCGPLGAIWPSDNHCSEDSHLQQSRYRRNVRYFSYKVLPFLAWLQRDFEHV